VIHRTGIAVHAIGLVVLALASASLCSAQKNDWLIVPGHRVGPITAAATRTDLDSLFGKDNVQDRTLDGNAGPEAATVVYGDEASAALAVTWDKEHVSTIHICYGADTGPCKWRTASGIRIGLPLQELEKLNGKSFQLAGFSAEERGAVTSWRHGTLEEDPAACGHLLVRLTPAAELEGRPLSKQESSLMKQLQGDKPYSSGSMTILELNPMVSALEVQFTGPGCAAK
jgi:hypothetical protein